MDVNQLKRDASKIIACLHEIEGDQLVCLQEVKIMIPARFAERNLASLGAETYVVGLYAIIAGEYYAVMQANAMMRIDPAETNQVMVNGDEYLEFVFYPGSVVIPNLRLAKENTLTYRIYDEILAKARVPWYLNYMDLPMIFNTAVKHAGISIGKNKELIQLLISIIARDRHDRSKYFRQTLQMVEDLKKLPYYASLKDVTLMATNTTAKLSGGNFRQGTVSAIVSPAERVESIEEILLQ